MIKLNCRNRYRNRNYSLTSRCADDFSQRVSPVVHSVKCCVSMSRLLALLFVFCIATPIAYSQDFKITMFEKNPLGLGSALANIKDNNGDVCALIKFSTRDTDFEFEANLGIVKTEKKVSEIWIYVPVGTRRINVKHPRFGILRHYEIPVRIEAKTDYEAEILIVNKPRPSVRKRNVFVNIGLGYNALNIMGPSAFIGLNIGAHNIEGGTIIGLNKVNNINFYIASNNEFMGTFDFSAMRFYARYGYDIKVGSSILLTPQIGAAINHINGAEIRRSTSGVNLFGNASGIITSVGCRLNWCLNKHIRLHITPEYDFCIKGDRGFNIIKDSDSKIASWSDGLNVNAGLVFHF